MTTEVPQTRTDLLAHLREQVGFLEASAAAFDAGKTAEAKRLALGLRILLHDKGRQKSLLGLLGVKDKLAFHDVVGEVDPDKKTLIAVRMQLGPRGMIYSAPPKPPKRRAPFDDWWNAPIYASAPHGLRFSRRSFVLEVAETDGGAHVDSAIKSDYARLSRSDNGIWEFYRDGTRVDEPWEGPIPAYVRQIVGEVLGTLSDEPII